MKLATVIENVIDDKKIKKNITVEVDFSDLEKSNEYSNKSDYVFKVKSLKDIYFIGEIEDEDDEAPLIHYYAIEKFGNDYAMHFLGHGYGENHDYIHHNFVFKFNA